jgi:hypothetical protein
LAGRLLGKYKFGQQVLPGETPKGGDVGSFFSKKRRC